MDEPASRALPSLSPNLRNWLQWIFMWPRKSGYVPFLDHAWFSQPTILHFYDYVQRHSISHVKRGTRMFKVARSIQRCPTPRICTIYLVGLHAVIFTTKSIPNHIVIIHPKSKSTIQNNPDIKERLNSCADFFRIIWIDFVRIILLFVYLMISNIWMFMRIPAKVPLFKIKLNSTSVIYYQGYFENSSVDIVINLANYDKY